MKRGLVYLLIAAVLFGWLGTLIARDPGYVLLSYDGASLQTGLWVFLFLVAFSVIAIYYGMRLAGLLMRSTGYFRSWQTGRKKSRAETLTARGLTFFEEGEYDRAERFLKSGATGQIAALNLIFAARSADQRGDSEARERYLREAVEADSDVSNAVAIADAEMAIRRRDYARALSRLADARVNDQVNRLKGEALLGLEDWQGLTDLMGKLDTAYTKEEMQKLQYKAAHARLAAPAVTDDALAIIYKKLPGEIRKDPRIVSLYCSRLASEKEAELAIRNCLKHTWDENLLAQYGNLGTETLARRIKAAEGWQKQHVDDPALQLCLGRLYEAGGDKARAQDAYQKAVDLGNSSAANAHLGRLLAFDGDYKKGTEYLNQALRLEGLAD